MKAFLFIFLAVTLSTVVHVSCMAIVGRLMGARIEIVSLFFGPKLLSRRIGKVDFRISLWPAGGYVKFYEGPSESGEALSENSFRNLHPLKRILIALAGPLGLVMLAAGLIGFHYSLYSFTSGFVQFFSGAVAPLSQGHYLVERLSEIGGGGFSQLLFGLIPAKMAAFNLLPFPTLNGGYIVLAVVQFVIRIPEKISGRISIVGFIITLILLCGWAVAFIHYLIR